MCGECITARDGNEDKLRQAAAATTEEESADVIFGMHEEILFWQYAVSIMVIQLIMFL